MNSKNIFYSSVLASLLTVNSFETLNAQTSLDEKVTCEEFYSEDCIRGDLDIIQTRLSELKSSLVDYSKKVAQKESMYEQPDLIQSYLLEKLSTRPHIKRFLSSNVEDYDSIRSIDNSIQLSIIKQTLDMFDNFSKEDFVQLFPKQYSSEHGGVIYYDGGLKLATHENIFDKLAYLFVDEYGEPLTSNDSYVNFSIDTILKTGIFHTHPKGPEAEGDSKEYHPRAGPSGYARQNSMRTNEMDMGDLGAVRSGIAENKYYISVVITEMDSLYYNVDIIVPNLNNLSSWNHSQQPIHIFDAGVWDYRKKKNK